ncbi:MAG: hypothetical protein AABN33_29265 [Acidobacteriota bacterium]
MRDLLTRKNIIIASSVLVVGLVVAAFFLLRRPPRVAMDRYIPADALAFVEITSLADLVDGFTSTKAWRELAPVLGLSSQLRQVGLVTDLIGRTGLGPDEAVVAGRAQYAIAITGIESRAGETEDGAYIHLKPNFALIVETHANPETVSRLVSERASLIAQKLYGESVVEHTDDYRGSQLVVFQGPEAARQLIVSTLGSLILVANQADAMKLCLDTIVGRAPGLAEDPTLKQMRPEVGRDPSVFAYVTPSGIGKLVELWPVLIAGRVAEPESISLFADLIEHLSKQAGAGLLYSSEFEADGVTEKYLTVLRPQVAEALTQPLKSASAASVGSLVMIPRSIESLTLLNVERAGELPERVLKQLSPTIDLVAGVALREFVIGFRKQYGLESSDSVGDAIGNEVALANFGDDQPRAMLIRVNDRARLAPFVNRYLTRKAASVTTEQDTGIEVLVSSNDDRRAAAFAGDFLVLGTRDQIAMIITTHAKRDGIDGDERLKQSLSVSPANASIVSYRPRVEAAGKLLLAISKLMRVTDGSQELLDRDSARKSLDRLPPSISFTEFRNYGVYTETRSAVGSFWFLVSGF